MKRLLGYSAVFVLGFGSCAALYRWSGGSPGITLARASTPRQVTITQALDTRTVGRFGSRGGPDISAAVARVEPAVVNIEIEGQVSADGLLRLLDPKHGSAEELFEGSGSGIILSSDGYVVTNNHVVEPIVERANKGKLTIRMDNGREFHNVEIVGRDPQSDLAVLRIKGASGLPAAELGESDSLRVGDWAIAVGNPLGFNSTVTLGIVSALNRRHLSGDRDALDRVIQTDASINPGSSGGALADIDGRVVGINTAIASATGGSVGIGFAIPINPAKRIIGELVKHGKVIRPYLGVMYLPVSDVEKKALPPGVTLPPDNYGALLLNERGSEGPAVAANSPAARAGLKPFDVIREIDGKTVVDTRDVKSAVQNHRVGDRIQMKVWRSGKILDLTAVLEAMPEEYGRERRGRRFPGRSRDLPFRVPNR